MKRSTTYSHLILDWLLVVPGLLGSVFCLITAFDLPASPELWWISIGSVTVFSLVLGHEKRDRVTAPLLLGVLAIPAYLFRAELLESFRNLWGVLATTYAKGYDFFRDYVPREATTPETVGTALLAVTAVEAYLCCLSVRVWKRTTPMALTLLICIAPCFVLIDTPPDILPLIAAVFSILTQAFSQSVRRRDSGEQFKAVIAAALLAASILGLLLIAYPQDSYSPPITWTELAQKMKKWGQERNNRGNVNAGLNGNPGSVNLTGLSALPNRPVPVLYVITSQDAELYLRGSSYTGFNGREWTRGSDGVWDQSMLFPYAARHTGTVITIETVDPEPVFYTTYQLTRMPLGGEVYSDAYVSNPGGSKTYSMQFIPDLGPIVNDNAEYRLWVQEHCLQVPEETRDGVLAWWDKQPLSTAPLPSDPVQLEAFAQSAADLVSGCAKYDRNPTSVPDDVDFCTWFLNDAETGYCVHYASSCVALFRSLGIPSRYVTGYICSTVANKQTRITNLHAHAWVEAWIGGRWVPIEPTPGDATEFSGMTGETPQVTESTAHSIEPTEITSPFDTRHRPDEHTRPTREAVPSGTTPDGTGTGPSQENPRVSSKLNLTMLWIFLGVICVPLLIVGRRKLKLRLLEKRLSAAAPNACALLLYRRMLRLKKHGGGDIPEQGVALAKKACFSQHTLSTEELDAMRLICTEQCSRLSYSGFWRRMYCKYVLAIL